MDTPPPAPAPPNFLTAPYPPAPQEIHALVGALWPSSPVRQIAEGLIRNTHQPLHSVDALFTALSPASGRPWQERAVAAWALGRVPLSPQERSAGAAMLMEALERDRDRTFRRTFAKSLALGYAPVLAWCVCFSTYIFNQWDSYPVTWPVLFFQMCAVFGAFASLPVLPLSFAAAWVRGRSRRILRTHAAESLGRLAAPESLGALAGALSDRNAAVRAAAGAALHAVLPTVTEDAYGTLGAASMENLGRALSNADALLAARLLDALGKVGTGAVLPYVERVAREGRMTRLRDAAQDALARIRERAAREADAQTLVRGSCPAAAPDSLLRPAAHAGPDEAPMQLLRATEE